jgi:hypothetical protein
MFDRSGRLAPRIVEGMVIVVIVVTLLAVALTADRVALIYAQGRIARRIEDRGFTARPHVIIAGFPFLTQVAARRLRKVVIRAAGKKLGPVEVKHLDLTMHEMHRNLKGKGRTASWLSGTALVGFAGFAGITGAPGLTLSADGPDKVKITVGLGRVSRTATARVTRAGTAGIRIAVISAGGIPVAILGALCDVTVPLPGLPPGVTIQSVSVTGAGVLVHITGQNVSFGNLRCMRIRHVESGDARKRIPQIRLADGQPEQSAGSALAWACRARTRM